MVGPDTSALPAAALVFNFSDDVGGAPPPEKAHHTGHSYQCRPQVLAVSCCTNKAVCLGTDVRHAFSHVSRLIGFSWLKEYKN